MPIRFLSIKNYETYQHYTKRNPSWIKLHLSILDDPDFLNLPDASKWHYIGLLLLASRHGNSIKPDKMYIKNRLGLKESLDLTSRFIRDHVIACHDKYWDSEERQRRDRGETEAQVPLTPVVVLKTGRKVRDEIPIPEDFTPNESHSKLARARGLELNIEVLHFTGKAKECGWVTKDWNQKFMNWMLQEIKYRSRRAN